MSAVINSRDPIPNLLGAFDAAVLNSRRALMRQGAEEHEAPRAERVQNMKKDLRKLVDRGDMSAYVFFAKRKAGGQARTLHEILSEAIESDTRLQRLVNLNTFYGEGEFTKDLRELILDRAAEEETQE